ncbi:MAG: aminotransferase class V-fold PLP-dependent enzyme [Planctomycetota bacterium]|nr:aminotransferase class V-fold PLP-dependent enzyme [Planctomycetota bacterium]
MTILYLDHAATTRVSDPVRAAMAAALDADFGNPSSRHPLGAAAGEALEAARRTVARAVGADAAGVVFTSGGTEANNLALFGLTPKAASGRGADVLVGPTEHPSVRVPAEDLAGIGLDVRTLALDASGGLDLVAAADAIDTSTALVAQMLVNNEFGTHYDVARLARAVRARGGEATHLHVDAVQALGKLPLDMGSLFDGLCGSLALSGHKVHGPKGVGALVLSRAALAKGRLPRPMIRGGGQQSDLRPGTENVPGILGFARAVELAAEGVAGARAATLAARIAFEEALAASPLAALGARVLVPWSDDGRQAPHVLSLLVPGAPSEVWLHHLEERSVYASAGSACQAKKKDLSPALLALGLHADEARRVLRFSFSAETTPAECRAAIDALAAVAQSLAHL